MSMPGPPEILGETRRNHRADTRDLLEALRVLARGVGARKRAARANQPPVPVIGSPSIGGSSAASQAARSIAVVQPTWGMPSAAMIRSSGRRRDFWIAAWRFSALFFANRSSPSRSSIDSR